MARLLILNLVWERLSRLILTTSRFWLEFRKSIFLHSLDLFQPFSDFFVLKSVWQIWIACGFVGVKLSRNLCGQALLGFSVGAAISLPFDRFSVLTRVSEIHFCICRLFSDILFCEMYVRHAVSMAIDVIFHYVNRCRAHDMSSFSHIPKRKTGPSLLRTYVDFGLRIMYWMWWIQHWPHLTIQAAVVRHAPELQFKVMYDTQHEWLFVSYCIRS